jgi:hypothetical protein
MPSFSRSPCTSHHKGQPCFSVTEIVDLKSRTRHFMKRQKRGSMTLCAVFIGSRNRNERAVLLTTTLLSESCSRESLANSPSRTEVTDMLQPSAITVLEWQTGDFEERTLKIASTYLESSVETVEAKMCVCVCVSCNMRRTRRCRIPRKTKRAVRATREYSIVRISCSR